MGLVAFFLGLVLAPLLLGVINRTKAAFAGRNGPPLLQLYFDLWKLLHKGAVYSRATTWIFRAAPPTSVAAVVTACALVPGGSAEAPLAFGGDLLMVAALLGLMRFFLVLAALDTGSAFEGMGASREVQFSALAEPALLLSLTAVSRITGSLSLSGMFAGLTPTIWVAAAPSMFLVGAAMFVVFLAENARIPVDDPNTHLELTMIHEVMVLDHGGPDFGFLLYAAALKHWVLGSLLVGVALPWRTGVGLLDLILHLGGMFLLAIATGAIESCMARLRLLRLPQLLVGAGTLAATALFLLVR